MRYQPHAYTIAAADQKAANDALEAAGLGRPFSVALVPASRANREPPATHFGCNGRLSEAEIAKINATLTAAAIAYQDDVPANGQTAWEAALARRDVVKAKTEE